MGLAAGGINLVLVFFLVVVIRGFFLFVCEGFGGIMN